MLDHDRYERIDSKLKEVAENTTPVPDWYHDLSRLGPDATEEQRLALFQAIRNSGCLPAEAGFFLVSWLIDEIATEDAHDALHEYEDRLEKFKTAYRLDEGGIWPAGTAPQGYQELDREYRQAWDDLFARKLDEFGEHEIARLFREDPERFAALSEAGRQFFAGPKTMEEIAPLIWVRQLVQALADCMTADSPMGPLGFQYEDAGSHWGIDVYPTAVELVGGAVDGAIVAPGFGLDLQQVQAVFDHVDALVWRSPGLPHDPGSRVTLEGVYQGRKVSVQIRSCPFSESRCWMIWHGICRKGWHGC